jgi:soluble lytic murein transglycosylase-like protein
MQGMVRPHVLAIAIVVVACAGLTAASEQSGSPLAAENGREVALVDLSAVRRLVAPLTRLRATLADTERAAAWADVSRVSEAILGRPLDPSIGFDEVTLVPPGTPRRTAAADGVADRDAMAYMLLGVGYSAHETADIISGRISKEALDNARRIRAAGLGRDEAADYLDREYRRVALLRETPPLPASGTASLSIFEPFIEKHSRAYGVDAAIVRAIIDAESAYSPTAVSRAGAIGLMQLMPATARELGVNPYVPEQNIEGGVRYLAGLLRMFGRLDLALVAYNGGPGYAQRYASGRAVLYGETCAYVRAVLDRLRPPALMR